MKIEINLNDVFCEELESATDLLKKKLGLPWIRQSKN